MGPLWSPLMQGAVARDLCSTKTGTKKVENTLLVPNFPHDPDITRA